jgi:hypothetical protein
VLNSTVTVILVALWLKRQNILNYTAGRWIESRSRFLQNLIQEARV